MPTATVVDVMQNLIDQMPPEAQAVYADTVEARKARLAAGGPLHVEDGDARAEDARAREEVRQAAWRAACPSRFRRASLDDLTTEQGAAVIRAWVRSPDSPTLILCSPTTGNGKTHAGYAAARALFHHGMGVRAVVVPDLLDAMRPDGDPGLVERVTRADVTFLDDLGREKPDDRGWVIERLWGLVDYRTRMGLRTIVTTNLLYDGLVARYGDALVDRLSDGAVVVQFTGPTRRKPMPSAWAGGVEA